MSREANETIEGGGRDDGAPWLAHLAHDLRGPLSPLAMAVSLLQTGRAGPQQQPELLALMQRQIESLTQLLDDTADLLVARQRPEQAVDLASLLDMLKTRLSRRLRAAEVTLVVAAPAEPLFVAGEMRDLLRLVGDLALRSAEIGGHGSTLSVDADREAGVPQLRLQIAMPALPDDASARCASVAAVLNAPSQAHVADARLASVLRRYGITLAAVAAPGFVLQFCDGAVAD